MTLFSSSHPTAMMQGFVREQPATAAPSLNILFQSLPLPPLRPGTLNIPATPVNMPVLPPTPMEDIRGTHQIG